VAAAIEKARRSVTIRMEQAPYSLAELKAASASIVDRIPAYQQILAVFTAATDPMRAKDVCLALGIGTTPKYTEGLRAKLKRLVARQVPVEASPGLFALAPTASSTQDR
jgi:hypothetical protein